MDASEPNGPSGMRRLIRKGRSGTLTIRREGHVIGKITHRKVRGRWRWEIETPEGVAAWYEETPCNLPPIGDN